MSAVLYIFTHTHIRDCDCSSLASGGQACCWTIALLGVWEILTISSMMSAPPDCFCPKEQMWTWRTERGRPLWTAVSTTLRCGCPWKLIRSWQMPGEAGTVIERRSLAGRTTWSSLWREEGTWRGQIQCNYCICVDYLSSSLSSSGTSLGDMRQSPSPVWTGWTVTPVLITTNTSLTAVLPPQLI